MSTLYVDRKDIELRYAGGVIEIYEPSGKRGTIPLVGLERVVLHGRVQISTSVIGACVEAGASVALLGGRRSRYLATCVGKPHNDVQRRLGQFLSRSRREGTVGARAGCGEDRRAATPVAKGGGGPA